MQPDLVGRQLGGYLLEEEIGRGGMAWVWRARHLVLGRPAALKILAPVLASDEKFVERFLREARAAAQLEHPNIVPVYETGETDGYHYIAMKLLEGRTLREGIERGPAPPEEVSLILTQVADALDYAHSRGFVHRDVKPGNIMIDDNFRVTLTDFGIARAADDMSITATGLLVGTPAYLAPEQAQGLPATPGSDIYALGVLVYELLTGKTPFADRTPHAVILAHMQEPPQPVHERIQGIAPGISAVVDKALAKRPEERYASAGEFARAFSAALGSPSASIRDDRSDVSPATIVREAHTREHRRKRLLAALTGVVLLAACIVATAVIMTDDDPAGVALEINSSPAGATVWVNGVQRGLSPVSIDGLNAGEYDLRLELASYDPHEETLTVSGTEDSVLNVPLQPRSPDRVVHVSRATTSSALVAASAGLREPDDVRTTFEQAETVYAYVLVNSDAYRVRDIEFTFTSRWYGPDGTLRATSRPQRASFSADGQVWYLSANAVAGDIDPDASGEPCLVELYVDDVVIQTLEFLVVPPGV
jgi:serine/threonine protein kinase